ncbi:MAG: tRNA 4-thiouridine(8) synthase ThiI [Mycoplasmataceae bacterium]|jgi:thiamine biosynthesis protein ThiI|nr:tRNA 4-thiouridine(8) synthase ThiI [Mycoplasmataceae bacterium]
MKNIIYIKYGELTLKGKNKMSFINCLYTNLKKALISFKDVTIHKQYDSATISGFTTKNKDKIVEILKQVPGISLIIPAYIAPKDFAKLGDTIVKQLMKNKITHTTFKVDTKRADKSYPLNSMEVSTKMGGVILRNFKGYSVDVHKPQLKITIEIKLKEAIFYFEKIKGFGGFPLGINGRILLLISGGIDSPVAAKLLMKKGFYVDFLTFISPPHTDDQALDKVKKLKRIITLDGKLENSKLYIVNFTPLQHEIAHISIHSYQITIMRRYFFRIAHKLALIHKYDAIATGESLGQVASQTIDSMQTIQNAIGESLVLRPLLSFDKSEIIELGRQYGTYETSILPFADSCSLFVPTNPVTRPTIHTAAKLEAELELASEIIERIINKNIKVE